MRHLLISTISVLSLITLTACNGGSSGGGGGASNTDPDPAPAPTDPVFVGSESATINPLDMVSTTTPNDTVFDSATYPTLADVTDDTLITLSALAVTLNDNGDYTRADSAANTAWDINDKSKLQIDQQITPTRITGATANITFNATADSATINYGDAGESLTGTVTRNTLFGLASDYVAYINWNINETEFTDSATTGSSNNIHGMAIAGVLTEDGNIPLSNTTTFTGAGAGVYGTVDGGKDVTFDVTTVADFTNTNVNITANNTKAGTEQLTQLDFAVTNINYATINNINHSFTDLDGMAGSLDARFYGNAAGGGANEFGGTFAVSSATNYYYGAFYGGQRGILRPSEDLMALTSLNDANRANKTVIFDIDSLVGITRPADGMNINAENITGTLEFAYNGLNFLSTSIKFYLTDTTYQIITKNAETDADYIQSASSAGSVTSTDGIAPNTARLDRRVLFGFQADYMLGLRWKVLDNDNAASTTDIDYDYDNYGFGVTGFETASTALIPSGVTIFKGEGWGRYSDSIGTFGTSFDITATVDFGARNVALATTDTCSGECINTERDDLNFTGNLSYNTGTNAITGAVTTAGLVDTQTPANNIASLSGTAQAKFYGANAEEFGGTFNFGTTDSTIGYVGLFGTERGYVIDAKDAVATDSDNVPVQSLDSATSFVVDGGVQRIIALPVASMAQITTDNTANIVTNETFTGGAVSYRYGGGSFDISSMKRQRRPHSILAVASIR